jgi:hypothetical protein
MVYYGISASSPQEGYVPDTLDGDPYEYFTEPNSRTLLLAFLVMLIVFGLLFVVEVYWTWSLLVSFIAGAMFWYFYAV